MNESEDYPLPQPYTRTQDDDDCIALASPGGHYDKDDWKKDALDPFKKRLRDYLWPLQKRRCAYCRCVIHRNESSEEIEHIIPKHAKPQWMYKPMNLCLSCKMCNTKKSIKTVYNLPHSQVVDFPTTSDGYKIIHPYLDQYSDHIEIVDDILYRGITSKGRETIKLCVLNRYQLAATRAEEAIKSDANHIGRYLQILLILNDQGKKDLVDDADALINELNIIDIVAAYRQQNGM